MSTLLFHLLMQDNAVMKLKDLLLKALILTPRNRPKLKSLKQSVITPEHSKPWPRRGFLPKRDGLKITWTLSGPALKTTYSRTLATETRAKELHHLFILMVSCYRINFYLPFANSKERCFKGELKSFHIRAKMIFYFFFKFRNKNFSNFFIAVLKNTSINSISIGQLIFHFISLSYLMLYLIII